MKTIDHDLDRTAALLVRMDRLDDAWVAAGGGPTFNDHLRLWQHRYCGSCAGDVQSCRLLDAVRDSKWADNKFCVKCWGRVVELHQGEGADPKMVYDSSQPVYAVHAGGLHLMVARCDCEAGQRQHIGWKVLPGEMGDYRCAIVRDRAMFEMRSGVVRRLAARAAKGGRDE